MSRNVSLLELRTWARQLSDTENDDNISDTELTALANRHLPEVYDRLVDAGPADYYASSSQVVTTSGLSEYALDNDFRNLLAVYVRESSDERRRLQPMPHAGRGNYKAPSGAWTVDLEFIPVPDTLVDDADTFDGVSGFEELIANLMARDVMIKRESDPSVVMSNIARLEARIVSRARSRDKGAPRRITDLDDASSPWTWTGGSKLSCYRLRAGNIELYENLGGWP